MNDLNQLGSGDPKQIGLAINQSIVSELRQLPNQNDIEFKKIKYRNIAEDLEWDVRTQFDPAYQVASQRYPKVEDYLADAENWKIVFGDAYIDAYFEFCFFYNFKPNLSVLGQRNLDYEIDAKYPLPNQGLVFEDLDKAWDRYMFSSLPVHEIGVSQNAIRVLETAAISSVSDYVLRGGLSLKREGLSQTSIKRMNDYLRQQFGIDKSIIAACPTLRDALATKKLVKLASMRADQRT